MIYVAYAMKAKILLQTLLSKSNIQYDSKSLGDINTFKIFTNNRQYIQTAAYLWLVHPINVKNTVTEL